MFIIIFGTTIADIWARADIHSTIVSSVAPVTVTEIVDIGTRICHTFMAVVGAWSITAVTKYMAFSSPCTTVVTAPSFDTTTASS